MLENSSPPDGIRSASATYALVERELRRLIRRKAVRLRGRMTMDDALQEARLEIFRALPSYDPSRPLARFVGVCLRNKFASLHARAHRQKRMPHTYARIDGSWVRQAAPPRSLGEDDALEPSGDPESQLLAVESEGFTEDAISLVRAQLSERDRDVLDAFVTPPGGVALQPGERGYNRAIAAHLVLTKNKLDWSIARIRDLFFAILREHPHLDGRLSGPDWPYLVWTQRWDDRAFVERSIIRRQLNSEVRCREVRATSAARMFRQAYSWGEVLSLRLGSETATLFLQGHFNPLSGILKGRKYGRRPLPIAWYARCMKTLDETETKA